MKPRLIIHHSFGRTSQSNWYQSVAHALADQFDVLTPDAPNTELGKLDEWLPAFTALAPDENTVLVGHSLGGDVVLRYLEQSDRAVKAIFLVATPTTDLNWDDLRETGFFKDEFQWENIKKNVTDIKVMASTDDKTVPLEHAERLHGVLGGKLQIFDNKGHFNQETFPELVSAIKELLNERTN